jgi:hypothetical protein
MVNPWLATTVAIPYLVIVIGMSGVRQAAAIGLVFIGLVAFQQQRGWRFVAALVVAATIHASSILVLPLAGLSFARNRLQSAMLIAMTAVAAYYLLGSAFGVYSERYIAKTLQSTGTLYRIAMNVFPAILYLIYRRHFPFQPHEQSLMRNLSVAALLTLPLYFVVASSTAIDRMSLYLFPLQIYVLSAFPSVVGRRGGARAATLAIITYLGVQLFLFLSYGLNKDPYIPYRTVFSADIT